MTKHKYLIDPLHEIGGEAKEPFYAFMHDKSYNSDDRDDSCETNVVGLVIPPNGPQAYYFPKEPYEGTIEDITNDLKDKNVNRLVLLINKPHELSKEDIEKLGTLDNVVGVSLNLQEPISQDLVDAISKNNKLEYLDIHDDTPWGEKDKFPGALISNQAIMQVLDNSPNLKFLKISDKTDKPQISMAALANIAKSCPKLKKLDFNGKVPENSIQHLAGLPLESLTLTTANALSDRDVSALNSLTNLEHLTLSWSSTAEDVLCGLMPPNLKFITIDRCPHFNDKAIMALLANTSAVIQFKHSAYSLSNDFTDETKRVIEWNDGRLLLEQRSRDRENKNEEFKNLSTVQKYAGIFGEFLYEADKAQHLEKQIEQLATSMYRELKTEEEKHAFISIVLGMSWVVPKVEPIFESEEKLAAYLKGKISTRNSKSHSLPNVLDELIEKAESRVTSNSGELIDADKNVCNALKKIVPLDSEIPEYFLPNCHINYPGLRKYMLEGLDLVIKLMATEGLQRPEQIADWMQEHVPPYSASVLSNFKTDAHFDNLIHYYNHSYPKDFEIAQKYFQKHDLHLPTDFSLKQNVDTGKLAGIKIDVPQYVNHQASPNYTDPSEAQSSQNGPNRAKGSNG